MPDYHAKKSPSGMKRRLSCPGSDNLISQLPERKYEPNKYAAEGTVAHEIGELCISQDLEPDYFLDQTKEADGFKFLVDMKMVEAVEVYVNWVDETINKWEEDGFKTSVFVEVWGTLTHLNVPGMEGGTSDLVIVVTKGSKVERVIIGDYKHGQGVEVHSEWNPQLLCYAEAICHWLKTEKNFKLTKTADIELVIVQPRIRTSGDKIKSWELDYSELQGWVKEELVPGVLLTYEEDAPLIPGDEQCRFCDAKAECSALANLSQELAIREFDDYTEDPKELANGLSHEQKLKLIQNIDLIRSFILAVEANVTSEMIRGETTYEGFKLVRKTTHRKLTDVNLLDLYLEEDEIYDRKIKSISDIEKTLKIKYSKKEAMEVMEEITERPQGGIVLAPENDKRPSIEQEAQNEFSDFIDEDEIL